MLAADKRSFIAMFLNGKSLAFLNGWSLSCIFHIQGASELNVGFFFHTGIFNKHCRCRVKKSSEKL